MLLVEVGAGVAAGVGVPPEVEDDGFSVGIETILGKIGLVPETQKHRRLRGKHALREEMEGTGCCSLGPCAALNIRRLNGKCRCTSEKVDYFETCESVSDVVACACRKKLSSYVRANMTSQTTSTAKSCTAPIPHSAEVRGLLGLRRARRF